jgi:hypothetical protein
MNVVSGTVAAAAYSENLKKRENNFDKSLALSQEQIQAVVQRRTPAEA